MILIDGNLQYVETLILKTHGKILQIGSQMLWNEFLKTLLNGFADERSFHPTQDTPATRAMK